MPDYATMYRKLFNAQTDTIETLQSLTNKLITQHQEVEGMYINAPEPELIVLGTPIADDGEPNE